MFQIFLSLALLYIATGILYLIKLDSKDQKEKGIEPSFFPDGFFVAAFFAIAWPLVVYSRCTRGWPIPHDGSRQ